MMVTTQFFAMKIQRYLHDHDLDSTLLAEIAAKNLRNGSKTPHAWRRTPRSVEEILAAPMVNDPLTSYMFCSPSEGAAAIVLASDEKAKQLNERAVRLRAVEFRTRKFGTFEVFSPWLSPDREDSPSVFAARAAFETAGIGPDEIDVAQLQDTEAGAELMHLAECGFCEHGQQRDLIESGALEIDGTLPVNTDGGLIANGEPIGASGLRQVIECVLQLQGRAGDRQVGGEPKTAFTHVYGAPGLSTCTVLSR
ncbi:MAG: thiolase family protein [Ilumatobacteraceae bacterium]